MDPSISSARIPDPASGVAFLQVWDTDSAAARSGWFQDMSVNIHLLRAKPGFVSMTLHRSLDQKSLCVYAQWTSQTHLGSAVIDPYVQGARAKLDRWTRPDGRPYTFHSLATPTASRGGARTIWANRVLRRSDLGIRRRSASPLLPRSSPVELAQPAVTRWPPSRKFFWQVRGGHSTRSNSWSGPHSPPCSDRSSERG